MTIILGFDFGMKHIGVAVGETITGNARPLSSLKARDGIPNWTEIHSLIKSFEPSALVVGIPLNMDGTEQAITFCAKKFMQRLHHHTELPVHPVDERLSSFEAKQRLVVQGKLNEAKTLKIKKQQIADLNAMAAAVLVEQFLATYK